MFKKIIGIGAVALLFSCSDDGGGDPEVSSSGTAPPSSSSAGESSSSEAVCSPPCGPRIALADFNGTAITKFGSWAFVYADNGGTIENEEDTQWGGYIGMVLREAGRQNKVAQLTNFNAETGDVGIGIGVIGDGVEEEPVVSLDTLTYFRYEHKGAAHQFRMQKEPGVFWMQKVPASDDWIWIYIDISDEESFVEGEEGLGPYDPSTVTQIQWVPDIDINTTGTLSIDNFDGFAR